MFTSSVFAQNLPKVPLRQSLITGRVLGASLTRWAHIELSTFVSCSFHSVPRRLLLAIWVFKLGKLMYDVTWDSCPRRLKSTGWFWRLSGHCETSRRFDDSSSNQMSTQSHKRQTCGGANLNTHLLPLPLNSCTRHQLVPIHFHRPYLQFKRGNCGHAVPSCWPLQCKATDITLVTSASAPS